jgi:hypothetical protein
MLIIAVNLVSWIGCIAAFIIKSDGGIMKKYLVLTVLLVLCSVGYVFAADGDIDMDLACPTKVTAGAEINTTVKLTNHGCAGVSVQRYMTVIGGNSSANTLSNAGIWGPFPKSLPTAVVVPAAQCIGGYPSYPEVPGVKSISVSVGTAPAAMTGTMAMVMVNFITSSGKNRFSGNCMVQVQ